MMDSRDHEEKVIPSFMMLKASALMLWFGRRSALIQDLCVKCFLQTKLNDSEQVSLSIRSRNVGLLQACVGLSSCGLGLPLARCHGVTHPAHRKVKHVPKRLPIRVLSGVSAYMLTECTHIACVSECGPCNLRSFT